MPDYEIVFSSDYHTRVKRPCGHEVNLTPGTDPKSLDGQPCLECEAYEDHQAGRCPGETDCVFCWAQLEAAGATMSMGRLGALDYVRKAYPDFARNVVE